MPVTLISASFVISLINLNSYTVTLPPGICCILFWRLPLPQAFHFHITILILHWLLFNHHVIFSIVLPKTYTWTSVMYKHQPMLVSHYALISVHPGRAQSCWKPARQAVIMRNILFLKPNSTQTYMCNSAKWAVWWHLVTACDAYSFTNTDCRPISIRSDQYLNWYL